MKIDKFLAKNFLIFLFLSSSLFAQEQRDDIRSIDDTHNYLLRSIDNAVYKVSKFDESKKGRLSASRFEKYSGSESYYYNLNGAGEPVLKLVIINAENKDGGFYGEYMFDFEGNLMFHLENRSGEEAYAFEVLKAYFNADGNLIALLQDGEEVGGIMVQNSRKTDQILDDAQHYYQLFMSKYDI